MINRKSRILVVGAMQEEIEVLKTNRKFYRYSESLRTGIGKVNAGYGLGTYLVKNPGRFDEILDIGYAGGLTPELAIGDVCFSVANTYHDVDVTPFQYERGQIPECPQFFRHDPALLKKYLEITGKFLSKRYPNHSVHQVINFTGDIFIQNKHQLPDLASFPKGDLAHVKSYSADMESCAYAQVAYYQKIPITNLHIITDNLVTSKTTSEAFENNRAPVQVILNNLLDELLK